MCLFNQGSYSSDTEAPSAPADMLEQEAPSAKLSKNSSDGGGINAYRSGSRSKATSRSLAIRAKTSTRGKSTSTSGKGLTIGGITEDTKSGIGIGKV